MSGSFTLTGRLMHHDKVTPHVDSQVLISAVMYPDGSDDVIYSQGASVLTDANGSFSVNLLTETGLYYTVTSLATPQLFDPITFPAQSVSSTHDLTEFTTTVPGAVTPSVLTDALAAAVAAAASATAAAASAAAAAAVGSTNDTIIASRIRDETTPSATFTAIREVVGRLSAISYGADPTGTSDSTAAITAAVTASTALSDGSGDHGPNIYLPPGIYGVHDIDLTGKKILFEGDGPQSVKIRYNGAGGAGTTLFKSTTNVGGAISHGGFKGVYLDGKSVGSGTPMCESLYLKTGNTGHDLFWTLDHVSIANCTGDGFVFGPGVIVNLHADRLRVDGAMGWGFRLSKTVASEHRPITINHFTIDCGTIGDVKGLMRIDQGSGYYVRLSNGRMEGNHSLIGETVGAVTEKSWILNVNTLSSSFGAYFWLDNVMGFTQAADTTALVRDASGTNAIRGRCDVVNFDNCQLFRADGRSGNNVAVVSPQDMQTHFFTAG